MSHARQKRIALLGMYGGLWREYNPGCFFIGFVSHAEFRRRLPDAELTLFSIDGRGSYPHLRVEEESGLRISFFAKPQQLHFLEKELSGYDTVIAGGDVLWATKEPIFFVKSPSFLASKRPTLLFHCVHSTDSRESIVDYKEDFRNACSRAAYVSVRTPHMQRALEHIGVKNVACVPDPAFALDTTAIATIPSHLRLRREDKPLLGISLGMFFSDALIEALREIDLRDFDVWFYQYTRQNSSHETLLRVRKAFGNRFKYIDKYFNPVETFQLIGNFDISFVDTYHGTIAALLQGKSVVGLQWEDPSMPRLLHLFDLVQHDGKLINLAGTRDFAERVERLATQFPVRLKSPVKLDPQHLSSIRSRIATHFDRMAEIIRDT